jgi:hypothetical protein
MKMYEGYAVIVASQMFSCGGKNGEEIDFD